jgi:hypothetical protein
MSQALLACTAEIPTIVSSVRRLGWAPSSPLKMGLTKTYAWIDEQVFGKQERMTQIRGDADARGTTDVQNSIDTGRPPSVFQEDRDPAVAVASTLGCKIEDRSCQRIFIGVAECAPYFATLFSRAT